LESHPDKFSTLVSLATSAGVKLALHNDVGPFTLFAPTNAAWETVNYSSLDRPSLQQLLFHHLLRRQLALENGSGTGQYRTTTIELTTAAVTYDSSSGYAVNGVAIVQPINVLQTNGIVHTVDQVLVPPGFTFPAQ
jgi:transforming growth factor-beta-induced protein